MKHLIPFLYCLIAAIPLSAQIDYTQEITRGESLMDAQQYDSAYVLFRDMHAALPADDTLRIYSAFYFIVNATILEEVARRKENFQKALDYSIPAYQELEAFQDFFSEDFLLRKYFLNKNIIVAYHGLGNLEKAAEWRQPLYLAYKAGTLPDGIDEYFNFDYFRWQDKNVWGYEWYEELPEDRFSRSFSKIVYYVYSTDEDGNDKEQLYRLHVLMFHGEQQAFDYVLTKRLDAATEESSGTLYDYIYQEEIDYAKLRRDIVEVLKGNDRPSATTTVKKKN